MLTRNSTKLTDPGGGPITGGQVVPSHWRNTPQSGPMPLAGDSVGAGPVGITGVERPDERSQRTRGIVGGVGRVEMFVERFDDELLDADPATRGLGSEPACEQFGNLDPHRHGGPVRIP